MCNDKTRTSQQIQAELSGSATSATQEEVQRVILTLAEPLGLTVQFATGKRRSDVLTMQLQGDRQRAVAFYEHVTRVLPNLAIELFNVGDPEQFGMIAAVVNPHMPSAGIHNERRKHHPHSYLAKRD
ncbi:MAG: hypothetical protein AAF708_07385 [Deinococcota bacterium]